MEGGRVSLTPRSEGMLAVVHGLDIRLAPERLTSGGGSRIVLRRTTTPWSIPATFKGLRSQNYPGKEDMTHSEEIAIIQRHV